MKYNINRFCANSLLGVAQVVSWSSTFYFVSPILSSIVTDTGWDPATIMVGPSISLLVSGISSHYVARLIERFGSNTCLITSSFVTSLGLTMMSLSGYIFLFLLSWLAIGFGMSLGLNNAACAALVKLYGKDARRDISTLALWTGMCTTVSWPICHFLLTLSHWRTICFYYAIANIFIAVPAYILMAIISRPSAKSIDLIEKNSNNKHDDIDLERSDTIILLLAMTLSSAIVTMVSIGLIQIVVQSGMSASEAVAATILLGPAQIAARVFDKSTTSFFDPLLSMIFASFLVSVGIWIFFFGPNFAPLGICIYGFGIGLRGIARGTLPLYLVGDRKYVSLTALISTPALISQAISPFLGQIIFQKFGLFSGMVLVGVSSLTAFLLFATLKLRTRSNFI